MNIWTAYLNLENKYGKPTPEEAVKKLFSRAVQIADAKHMHLTLISMYERNDQQKLLDESLKKAVKKFSYSSKVWLAYIRVAVLKGDSELTRKLLDRATQSLPKHKHIKVMVRTALIEMKEGGSAGAERARTMFEGILRNYPANRHLVSIHRSRNQTRRYTTHSGSVREGDASRPQCKEYEVSLQTLFGIRAIRRRR